MNELDQNRWAIDVARTLRSSVGKYPIEPVAISLKLGFGVQEARTTAGEADIIKDDNNRLIIRISSSFKAKSSPARLRFTLAHELGHALLISYFNRTQDFSTSAEYQKLECVCNDFASELLVDSEFVHRKLSADVSRASEILLELSGFFGVSMSVISRVAVHKVSNLCVGLIQLNESGKTTINWAISNFDEFRETQQRSKGLNHLTPSEALWTWADPSIPSEDVYDDYTVTTQRLGDSSQFLCVIGRQIRDGSRWSETQLQMPLVFEAPQKRILL